MSNTEQSSDLGNLFNPARHELSNDEYQAVYDWVNREKDRFREPFRSGILKLLRAEDARRINPDRNRNPA